jgi:uncharacterized protein (TIGR03067 family)
MRRATGLVIVTLLLIAAAPAPKETAKEAAEKLQGTWIVEQQTSRGRDASEPGSSTNIEFKENILIKENTLIRENTLTRTRTYTNTKGASYSKWVTYTCTIDPNSNPPEMDLVQNLPDGSKGSNHLAIYLLDGDFLKICEGPPDGKRPKKFTSDKDSDNYLMILKRKKD